jgi:hypothetical protein
MKLDTDIMSRRIQRVENINYRKSGVSVTNIGRWGLVYSYKTCIFSFVDLQNIFISGAFTVCYFVETNLKGATIVGAEFNNCVFKNADLSSAKLKNSTFTNCNFKGAKLDGAKGLSSCTFDFSCTFDNLENYTIIPNEAKATMTLVPKGNPTGTTHVVPPTPIITAITANATPNTIYGEEVGDEDLYTWHQGQKPVQYNDTTISTRRAVLECTNIAEFKGCSFNGTK